MQKTLLFLLSILGLFGLYFIFFDAKTQIKQPRSDLSKNQNLHIYNWADYIDIEELKRFQNKYDIRITYDMYDSNQLLEARLLTGNSGYDVVGPSAEPYLERQIDIGLYSKLDKTLLTNYHNLDPYVLKILKRSDSELEYAIPWMWGTIGIALNMDKVSKILPRNSYNSLDLFFKEENIKKLAECGVGFIDDEVELFPVILNYLGLDPNSGKEEDHAKLEQLMLNIRPYIKYFSTFRIVNDLASGEICAAISFSGDAMNAFLRAKELGGSQIKYYIPKEGTYIWIDTFTILKESNNKANAHKFLNFLLEPEVAASSANYLGYLPANREALKTINKEIKDFQRINIDEKYIFSLKPLSPEALKLKQRVWNNIISSKSDE